MTAAAAMAFLPWVCVGQGVDYEHNWAHREGGAGEDFGRGVALWHDGTVCQLSEMATGPSGGSEMKLTLTWPGATGLEVWSRVDGGTGAGGEIFPRDIAAGNNFVDMGGHPPYPLARLHSVGSFVGEVFIGTPSSGGQTLLSGAGGAAVAAFVTRDYFDIPFPFQITNQWATAFTSTDVIEALTVASSPRGVTGGTASSSSPFGGAASAGALGPTDPPPDIYRPLEYLHPTIIGIALPTTVATGGYFNGTATFPAGAAGDPVQRSASGSTDDGFVALLDISNGNLVYQESRPSLLQISSSTGATRVTGIAIDPKDYTVAITGWYEAGNTNFDPFGGSFTPGSASGGRDIFVALYEPNEYGELFLKWLHVTGTQYDDEGAGVAFDSSGAVYATGWKGDAWGGGDLWIARFAKQTGGTFPRSINPAWQRSWATDSADVRGLDVAVDHLDRAVFTGRFGYTTVDIPTYCMDFDPGAGTDQHCTSGRSDIYVMRFRPNGLYDWGYSLGGQWDDIGAAVATEPMGTGRITIGGTFGIGGPSGYTLDFDPAGGGATLQSAGGADSFISALDQEVPEGILSQASFVFDNSGSMTEERYVALMTALRSKLTASGNVPTNGSVMLGFVVYAQDAGVPFMPWTVIDSPQTLSAFANRLARQALPGGGENKLVEGIEGCGAQFQFMTAPGAYRHLVAIAEEPGLGDPRAAIDALYTQGLIDQSSGIATFPDSSAGFGRTAREYMLDEIAGSVAQVPVSDPWEANLGMGASVPAMLDPDFPELLERFIKRVTVCPGDFDRDGFVDQGDRTAFQFAAGTGDDYADWNFDGLIDVGLGGEEYDEPKFETGWALGCGAP